MKLVIKAVLATLALTILISGIVYYVQLPAPTYNITCLPEIYFPNVTEVKAVGDFLSFNAEDGSPTLIKAPLCFAQQNG
jgi:hypothetical protein